MKFKNYFLILFFVNLYGCAIFWFGAGAGVGVTGYKYLNGQLEFTCNNSLNHVYRATKLTFDSLKIELSSEYRDLLEAKIIGIRKNGDKVTVKMKNIGNNSTWVGIRIGFLGDREASLVIKNKILSYLQN
ncbi:DUF3568 family protein [Desulfothermus sp.]